MAFAHAQSAVVADTVRGVVYDSLALEPLVGAVVSGAGVQTRTDSLGRFVLIASGPIRRVVAFHESLEQVGLAGLTAERPTTPGSWTAFVSTPGIATVWDRLCDGRRPGNGRGGIVFGTVRRAVDTTAVAGAYLELQWEDIQAIRRPSDTTTVFRSAVTRSSADGLFAFCGVQEFGQAGIVATSGPSRSANVLVPADMRPVRRMDLTIGEPEALTNVRGLVVDEQGSPVSDASILVDGLSTTVTTAATGRFQLVNVPLGSRMLVIRKLGYLPTYRTIDVVAVNDNDLVVRMERGVTLEGVKVTARSNVSLYRREFDERRRSGFAQLIDSTRLRQYPSLRTALHTYPALTVQTANNGTDFILLGRVTRLMQRCRVNVWVDGMLSDEDFLRVLPLQEIAATELFTSDAFAPARFRTFGNTCAVLLVWTRNFLR